MNNSQKVIEHALKRWQSIFDACECGGSGKVEEQVYEGEPDNLVGEIEHPCLKCAHARAMLKVWCLHEFTREFYPGWSNKGNCEIAECKHCGKRCELDERDSQDPDLTESRADQHRIVELIDDMGNRIDFFTQLIMGRGYKDSFNILVNATSVIKEYAEYLEGRE